MYALSVWNIYIYIYMCMYIYIYMYVRMYIPLPRKKEEMDGPQKGKQFPKGSLDHIPIDFPGGGMVSSFGEYNQKNDIELLWWFCLAKFDDGKCLEWVKCGFFGGLEDQTSSPVIFQTEPWGLGWWKMEGEATEAKKDPPCKWLMRDHLHGLFIYDCQPIYQ